jgi:hypothetical protein
MAYAEKTVTVAKGVYPNSLVEFTPQTTAAAGDGFLIPYDGGDHGMALIVINGATEGTLTLKKGDGIQGVADQTYTIGANKKYFIVLDSGRFKNTKAATKSTGDASLKGKVFAVTATSATITVAAVTLL